MFTPVIVLIMLLLKMLDLAFHMLFTIIQNILKKNAL